MTGVDRAGASRDEATRGLEHEIGKLLRRIRRSLAERAARVDPALSATALPLLATLVELGPHRAQDLAEMFALDKGAVSRIVHQLLDLGLIERSPDPEDGRASILEATAEAHRRFEALAVERRAEVDARLADWDHDSILALAEGLARFNAAISD